MELIDYTGKLNNHNDYIHILNKISEKCEYIEVVILDEKDINELVDRFKEDIIDVRKGKEWWGTEVVSDEPCNYLYRLKYGKRLNTYLTKFETFCKYYEYGTTKKSLEYGDYSERTDFGIDDIAFYDSEDNFLLWTTTHEGYIWIDENIIK